jgi:citrate synthase
MEAADCRSDFLHALVAGFSVGAGIYHQGGLRATMEELVRLSEVDDADLAFTLSERIASGNRIMGYGHRFHIRDPRVDAIWKVAERHGFRGRHMQLAHRIENIAASTYGLHMNIEAGGGSVLLDLGFDSRVAHMFIVVGRTPMFAAAYLERLTQHRKPFQRIEVVDLVNEDE